VKGLRNVFAFCGVCLTGWRTVPAVVIGLALRLHGWKSSGSSSTKLEGKRPTMRLSRFRRPIHHEPSPALRHSIRSPSMKPRSRFVCSRSGQWNQHTVSLAR
jgi:hypothetical protein